MPPANFRRSKTLLIAALDREAVVYDLASETLHRLNPTGGLLLELLGEPGSLEDIVGTVAEVFGVAEADARRDTEAFLHDLATLGLMEPSPPLAPLEERLSAPRSETLPNATRCFAVGVELAEIQSDDAAVIAEIDEAFAPMETSGVPGVHYQVTENPPGFHELVGPNGVRSFSSREALIEQLTVEFSRLIELSSETIVLHSGAVVRGEGTCLLPAASGSGKSTLTAALVMDGWGYRTDEAMAITADPLRAHSFARPIGLSPESRAALRLPPSDSLYVDPRELREGAVHRDPGPISRIVIPAYSPDAVLALSEPIDQGDAFVEILSSALNLARVGQSGFDVLAALARHVPTVRLTFSDPIHAAHALRDLASTA